MPGPSSSEPEGASPRELRRAERKAMNTEAFPEFAEPTLATDEEIEEVLTLHKPPMPATKPVMRVDAQMLRGSGLLDTLPEFLGQLARANLETETMLANNPNAIRMELDDDEAAAQPHVELNLFAGVLEEQRNQQSIVLPGNLAVQAPEITASTDGPTFSSSNSSSSEDEDDSGDETDASTSTTASLRANLRKRKAAELEDDESSDESSTRSNSPPNKIRLHVHYPTPNIRYFDMKRGRVVARRNPEALPDDPWEALQKAREAAREEEPVTIPKPIWAPDEKLSASVDERPTTSGSDKSNNSTKSKSRSPVPITKIRIPSRSPDGSRSSSPDRIIILRHPVVSRSVSPASDDNSESEKEAHAENSAPCKTKIRFVIKQRKKLIEEVE